MNLSSSKIFACTLLVALCSVTLESTAALGQGWPQWGQNPQHSGTVNVVGQPINNILANQVYDPFVPQEQAVNGGDLLTHYQAPLIDTDGSVYMEFETGTFTSDVNTRTWNEQKLTWQSGQLVQAWNFASDWKPEDPRQLGGWEPVFHGVLAGNFVYVPGFAGTTWKLNKADGSVVTRINPLEDFDANTFVSGPLSADSAGNVYYNLIRFHPSGIFAGDVQAAWLIRVATDDTVRKVSYRTITPGAPGPTDQCFGVFGNSQLPWPPSPTAVPSTLNCGSQRPGINVTPAIGPDGTIYTVSRAHFVTRYSFVVAVNPDLSPKWSTSLRNFLNDGCNNDAGTFPGSVLPANGTPGGCRLGANPGVDPATNQRPAGRVIDQSSSSPSVATDGSVLYGSYSRYNFARGHLWKLDRTTGQIVATYDFGWDSTPAVFAHDGTWSTIIKDNHYDVGSYCNNPTFCPVAPPGPYFITQLNASLMPEWKFRNTNTQSCTRQPDGTLSCVADHPNGFEWCINAPAVDGNGVVYANSEDGNLYTIDQGHTGVFTTWRQRIFLQLAIGAAYTPLSIGPPELPSGQGKIYSENGGHLFAIGN